MSESSNGSRGSAVKDKVWFDTTNECISARSLKHYMTNPGGHLGQQPTRWVSTGSEGAKSQVIGFGCRWHCSE